MTPSLDRAEVALRLACASASNFHGAPLPPKEFAASILSYADALLLALTPPVAPEVLTPDVPEGSTIAQLAAEQRASMGLTASMGTTQHFKHSAPVAPKSEAAKYEPAPGDVIDLYGGRGSCEPHMTRIAVNRDEYAALNCGKFEARYRYDLHPTVTPVFLRPATPAERAAAGLPSPEATRPTKFRIRRGATVCQDFRYFAWPGEYEDRADTEFTERKPVMFAADRGVNAVAHGFGVHGDADGKSYGNGSIYVTDAVDLIPTPPTPVSPSPEATRPTHVRVTGPTGARLVTIGKTYRVIDRDEDCERLVILNDDDERWLLGQPGEINPAFPTWEPATPPAPVEPAKPGTVENMAAHLAWCAWCGTDDRSELPYDAFRAGYRTALAARGGS